MWPLHGRRRRGWSVNSHLIKPSIVLTKTADDFLKYCAATYHCHHESINATHVTTFEYDHYTLNMVVGVLLSQEDTARSNSETLFWIFSEHFGTLSFFCETR